MANPSVNFQVLDFLFYYIYVFMLKRSTNIAIMMSYATYIQIKHTNTNWNNILTHFIGNLVRAALICMAWRHLKTDRIYIQMITFIPCFFIKMYRFPNLPIHTNERIVWYTGRVHV